VVGHSFSRPTTMQQDAAHDSPEVEANPAQKGDLLTLRLLTPLSRLAPTNLF
jgi:hypothetical protein